MSQQYKVWYIANPPDEGISFEFETIHQANVFEKRLIEIVRYTESRIGKEFVADVAGIMVKDGADWVDYEEEE